MNEASQTSSQPKSTASPNATFSQALADGRSHSGWLTGPTTDPSGQARALASHSVPPEKVPALMMNATYGPLFGGSSPSTDLQQSLANRLHRLLAVNGSPEYALTWKQWAMLSGPPICALRASARPTSGSGCSGWPTPNTTDTDAGPSRMRGDFWRYRGLDLATAAALAGWPTPKSSNDGDSDETVAMAMRGECEMSLPRVAKLAGWATPRVSDNRGAASTRMQNAQNGAGIYQLREQVHGASGPTPTSFPAATEKPGALNPEHSRWLMGYPAAWGCCGATAMLSCRKSPPRSSKPTKKKT